MSDEELLKRLVIFAIIMENGKGILSKSPGYIFEKYDSALNCKYPEALLDLANTRKLKGWCERWRKSLLSTLQR